MQNFNDLYQQFNSQLEKEIQVINTLEPTKLYEPVVYTLNMGGKRLRPVLLLMAHELYSSNFDQAYPVAFAIEMFHNFTLLHDDIMDGANLRRNKETIHIKYSNNTAILSGDAMSILSYDYLNKCKAENFRKVFDLYTHTALKICEGQQYDMDFETMNNVSVSEYLKMIGLKTAILIAASLKIGALIANAPVKDAELIYDFGYNLGMAFQLQDDYLDAFGDTNSFGKNIGGDIVSNKKTFLMLKALELAQDENLSELQNLISSKSNKNEEKIHKVKNIYQQLGVVELAKEKMDEFYNQAIHSLKAIDVDTSKKTELLSIAGKMMNRKS